jgi:2,4-dienoyl-CoA reductase-like NADH-dependent reductase (Old Yellow Enzyme family)
MTRAPSFPTLFSPLRLRGVELRNRIVSTAHGTTMSVAGLPTEATAAYHAVCARGGVGLIILEAAAVHASAAYNSRFLTCYTDAALPGFHRIAEAVHAHGATVFGQLYHPGAAMRGQVDGLKLVPVGPSHVKTETNRVRARMMTLDQIREVVVAYGDAASRLMAAGLDGVEINGRNGNLPAQFLNPRCNQRTDRYGGELGNRLRFLLDIIAEVRGRIGERVPLGVRVSAEPMDEIGLTPSEVIQACEALAPFVDYFDVIVGSIGSYAGRPHIVPPMGLAKGYTAAKSARLREATGRPVLVAGRITRPELAEQLLAGGQADLCGMTRALIADPELPNKARTGRVDDIRECIGCNQACIGHERLGVPVSCIQHPETGRETTLGPRSCVARSRRVIVAGGGPAGLKAAAVAAERGNRVTLYECAQLFGGQALLAAMIPGRSEFGGLVSNLLHEARRAGAELVCGVAVDLDLIRREAADAVIVATGSRPYRTPPVVADEMLTIDASQILTGEAKAGGSILIADERCDWVGMGVAEKLVREGRQVRLCVIGDAAGQECEPMTRHRWLGILHTLGVQIVTNVRIASTSNGVAIFQHVASLAPVIYEDADTLVLAHSHRSSTELEEALAGFAGDVHIVGDCRAPRTAEEAVYEGLMAGLAV